MLLIGDWAPGTKHVRVLDKLAGNVVLANQEGPLLLPNHVIQPAPKAGPNIFSTHLPSENTHFAFTLANNHLMDYGLPGLKATLSILDQTGFKYCGAGKTISEARRPLVVDDNGVRVGIIACCEAQFGVARHNAAGVAEFGPWVYSAIREMKQRVDTVIVSVHAAVEDSPWPSPYIQELYRSYIEAGATIVHGHHSHVPQGYEEYDGGVIFYGMGNFAVDPDKWHSYHNWLWSVGADIDFTVKPPSWRVLTLEIRHKPGSDSMAIDESTIEEKASHRHYLELCNRPLAEPDLFAGLWQEVALRAYHHYGADYMRFATPPSPRGCRVQARKSLSMLRQALLNRIPAVPHPSRHDYLLWYHMIACESHRQMLATALGVLGGEIEDSRTDETRRLADEMMPWSVGVVLA